MIFLRHTGHLFFSVFNLEAHSRQQTWCPVSPWIMLALRGLVSQTMHRSVATLAPPSPMSSSSSSSSSSPSSSSSSPSSSSSSSYSWSSSSSSVTNSHCSYSSPHSSSLQYSIPPSSSSFTSSLLTSSWPLGNTSVNLKKMPVTYQQYENFVD